MPPYKFDMNNHQAYRYAEKIDNIINQCLGKYALSKANWASWQLFHRTVQTYLNILQKHINDVKND